MLQLNNVTSGYGGVKIVDDLSFKLSQGEICTLIGLNGSGKSTLLKTILGLIRPVSGDVLIDNQPLSQLSFSKRASKISLLPAESDVPFSMSVRELLDIGGRGNSQTIVGKALAAVGLSGYEGKNLLELSSGERRRAFIAHVLCGQSEIVLLDEPFSHLDWQHQNQLIEAILRWRDEFQTTFVLAIHELYWCPVVADRVIALQNGRILCQGAPHEVLGRESLNQAFEFSTLVDKNPIDGRPRLTIGKRQDSSR